jgi:hypothetical protein
MIDAARRLLHLLDPVVWAEEAFGFIADDWQARLLRSRSPQLILNCGRQVGKSSVIALLACHTAVMGEKALVLLIAPSQRQSRELAVKVTGFLRDIEPTEALEEDNKLSVTLARNGSRIIALPGNDARVIRGYSAPALIVEDEAAFVHDATRSWSSVMASVF